MGIALVSKGAEMVRLDGQIRRSRVVSCLYFVANLAQFQNGPIWAIPSLYRKKNISTVGTLLSPYNTKTDALFRVESTTYYFKGHFTLDLLGYVGYVAGLKSTTTYSITYFVVDLPSIVCPIELKLTHETFYEPQQALVINIGYAFCKRHKSVLFSN